MKNDREKIRPTTGKALQALFNILGAAGQIKGARFLELFAGTGAVSIAALEHGAAEVTAVELDGKTARDLEEKFDRVRFSDRATVIKGDVRRVVPVLADHDNSYDVIFADPPYCLGWGKELPALIRSHPGILAPGGVFVFERSRHEEPVGGITGEEADDGESTGDGEPRDDRRYGDSVLTFFRAGGPKRKGEGV